MSTSITAVIIAQNEAEMIGACIDTLGWCERVLVIDDGSTDATAEIAEQKGAQLISFKHDSFAKLRSEALKHSNTDWIFYIDADERVTPALATEIQKTCATTAAAALQLLRTNYFFGEVLEHGGWETDTVTRVFRRESLSGWTGDIHESPAFSGKLEQLSEPLLHFSHRDVASGLRKSADWTQIEARLLYEAGTPEVGVVTILRKGIMEVLRRVVFKQGYKDGMTGVVEGLIQGINRMLVYMQVWELQRKPGSAERYAQAEKELRAVWKHEQS